MEGPSIHLLALELKPLKNNKIIDVYGNAKFEKSDLLKQKIVDIYAFGKRLIIQLEHHAIIVHFLMYGSYRVNQMRKEFTPRLALITKTNQLYLYNCSVKCIKKENVKEYLPLERDILSDDWDLKNTVKLMKLHPNETIDDILLDQDIFPGVGNIIKNEALFLSKTLPTRKINSLTMKQLNEIAKQSREFSLNFYKWRKVYQLKKHLFIYRKNVCPICNSKVSRKKTGKRNRWSFFCINCQK